jgi:hypothetical protein
MQHAVTTSTMMLLHHHLPLHLAVINVCVYSDVATVVAVVAVAVCSVKTSVGCGGGSRGSGGLSHTMFHACRVCCALTVALVRDIAKRWINKRYI